MPPAGLAQRAVNGFGFARTADVVVDLDPFAGGFGSLPSSLVGTAVAGVENLRRQMRRLRSNPNALAALMKLGIGEALINRFSQGFKEPYATDGTGLVTENALAYPVHAGGGGLIGRFTYKALPGVP